MKISTRDKLDKFIKDYLQEHGSATSKEIIEYIFDNNLNSPKSPVTTMVVTSRLRRIGEKAGIKYENIAGWQRKYVIYKYKPRVIL